MQRMNTSNFKVQILFFSNIISGTLFILASSIRHINVPFPLSMLVIVQTVGLLLIGLGFAVKKHIVPVSWGTHLYLGVNCLGLAVPAIFGPGFSTPGTVRPWSCRVAGDGGGAE